MKLSRKILKRMILREIKRINENEDDNFIQRGIKGFSDDLIKDIDQKKGRGPMSPRTLRAILRNFPFNISSGFTAYAKHKPTGKEGILVFGLNRDDLSKKKSLYDIKLINQHHGPKKGVKSIAMYPGGDAKDFEIKGGSSAIKRIEDDQPFNAHVREDFQDYLEQLRSEVFLFKLKK